ncbi:hypothetical protein F5I97DRAFT_1275052 [Phlebopus sp. FC_14]|nr:hypothetical protein F5I97DRAFT_1275052 [Phlebopus sp. FC_14]
MTSTLDSQLQELQLVRCSLLPGENFSFVLPPGDALTWSSLLERATSGPSADLDLENASPYPSCQAQFQIKLSGARIWFEVELPKPHNKPYSPEAHHKDTSISVKGVDISRDIQEHWKTLVREKWSEVENSEYPVYELFSFHLLPTLHEEMNNGTMARTPQDPHFGDVPCETTVAATPPRYYHALLTSHHLVSPTKRRSMQQWSAELGIIGFAKVGYPGVIYAEGAQESVEEFVANVKAMQWLALRARFVEPVESVAETTAPTRNRSERWVELQKIGEVLEQMKRRGREKFVTELGIGSSSI